MTRVEKDSGLREEVTQLETEVAKVEKTEVREHGKGKWKLAGCGILFLIFLILVGAAAWVAAASGLVTIPVLSSWAYHEPQSIHKSEVGPPADVYLSETFNSLLTQRLQAGSGSLTDRSMEISLPESSLTTSFRDLLVVNNLTQFDNEKVQVALDKEQGIELFLPLANQPNNNALRLLASLKVENSQVALSYVKISIGSLAVPEWLSNTVLKPFLAQGLDLLNQEINQYAKIENIQMLDGSLLLSGTLTVEVANYK